MNKNIHSWKRLLPYLYSIPLSILSLFIKRDNKKVIFNSFLNQRYDSNSKYLFLWFIENVKNYSVYFVINEDDLRNRLNATIGDYFIETNSFKGNIFALKVSTWLVSSLEFPVGGFFLSYKRNIIYLGHGTPLKNIGLGLLEKKVMFLKKVYYKTVRTNLSYALASSEYFKPIISKFLGLPIERILVAGQSRNDQLFMESDLILGKNNDNDKMKNILYAPTWRITSDVKFFPFDDLALDKLANFLLENNINIYIRTHPNFEEEIDDKILNIPNVYLFSARKYPEIMDYLNLFDLLITDYSSIYFDYLLLDRPLIFLPYDYDTYNKEIGFSVPYHDFTPGYKPSTMREFVGAIRESFYGEDRYKSARESVNRLCNTFQQNNRQEFVSLLYKMGILE